MGKAYEGRVALTIEDAVKDADVVITCTGRDEDMMEIVFSDDGMMPYLKKGSIFIDHTTTSFKLAKHLNESLKSKNIAFIDAPVSGGEAGAINGVLSVMAGGDAHILDACDSIIKTYSKSITLMGDSGSGQLAKMVNQICIAGLLQGLSEGLLFAESENLNMDKLLSAISGGAAQSWQMVNRGKTMHQREFDFGFAIKWMVKDLGYCLDQAEGNNTKLAFTQEIYDRYTNLMDGSNPMKKDIIVEEVSKYTLGSNESAAREFNWNPKIDMKVGLEEIIKLKLNSLEMPKF